MFLFYVLFYFYFMYYFIFILFVVMLKSSNYLIEKFVKNYWLTKKMSRGIMKDFFQWIKEYLITNKTFSIVNFWLFSLADAKERKFNVPWKKSFIKLSQRVSFKKSKNFFK